MGIVTRRTSRDTGDEELLFARIGCLIFYHFAPGQWEMGTGMTCPLIALIMIRDIPHQIVDGQLEKSSAEIGAVRFISNTWAK